MPYWRLFYHIVWATKARQPVLEDADARIVSQSIRTTLRSFKADLHAVGVMPDHVHLATSIPPNVALAEVIGRLKGASAHALNHQPGRPPDRSFSWQTEYGILSFGEKALPTVIQYIQNQKQHHASQQLWPTLENPGNDKPPSGGLSD
jgi:putative transposase